MDYLCKGLQGLPARRKAAGFTQEAFAEALGVTRSALAAWETGRAWPSAAILPLIADLLLCSIDDLYKLPAPDPGPTEGFMGPDDVENCSGATTEQYIAEGSGTP